MLNTKKPTQTELNQMLTTSQIHSAMEQYAKNNRQPSLKIKTLFLDGSETIDEFEPSQKEVFYRVKFEDGEQYCVYVDIPNKYQYNGEPKGKSKILFLEKQFLKEHNLKFKELIILEDNKEVT